MKYLSYAVFIPLQCPFFRGAGRYFAYGLQANYREQTPRCFSDRYRNYWPLDHARFRVTPR